MDAGRRTDRDSGRNRSECGNKYLVIPVGICYDNIYIVTDTRRLQMDGSFFSEDDLAGLFSELDEQAIEEEIDQMADRETDASYQRFKEIIEKHRSE